MPLHHLELRRCRYQDMAHTATNGQTYHSTNTLHPPEGEERQYGQLYIIEGNQAVIFRMNAAPNSQCLRSVMETINRVMRAISPYASAYRHMHAIEQAEESDAQAFSREPLPVRLFFKRGPDSRRYLPSVSPTPLRCYDYSVPALIKVYTSL